MSATPIEELGPNGNAVAYVEVSDDVCYFYLHGEPDSGFGVRSVWVRNLVPAPATLDMQRLQAGLPPLNPARHCRDSGPQTAPVREDLHIVWLPEGNGAALFEGEEVLAIIPPWSGLNGFHGYARDCLGQGPVAWSLTPDNVLLQRFTDAVEYWRVWDEEDPWGTLQPSLCTRIESHLGPASNYYAIDGGQWPPKALLRIPCAVGTALVTAGLCARPQPNVELSADRPEDYRRVELGVLLPATWPDHAVQRFASYLSGQSDLPWSRFTWFGPGHTTPCDSWLEPRFTAAILVAEHPELGCLELGTQFEDPVRVLWFLPITEPERSTAQQETARDLLRTLPRSRWREA